MTRSSTRSASASVGRLLLASIGLSGCVLPVHEVAFDVDGQLQFLTYDDPDAVGDFVVLPEANVRVRDAAGNELDAAVGDGTGLWTIDVDPGQDIDIIVEASGRVPTVRRAVAPETTAQLRVPVYPRSADLIPVLMDELSAVDGLDFADSSSLLAGQTGALVVEPLVPEDWLGAEVAVTDAEGRTLSAVQLTAFEDGSYAFAGSTPTDLLLVSELPAGQVTLEVVHTSGQTTTQSWTVAAGELVDGRDFALAGGS